MNIHQNILNIYILKIYLSSSTGCSTTSARGPRPISQSTNHGAQLLSTKPVRFCWKQPQCYWSLITALIGILRVDYNYTWKYKRNFTIYESCIAGHHVGGQGKWGNCGPGCPIPPGIRSSELCDDNGSYTNSTRHLNIPLIFPATIYSL